MKRKYPRHIKRSTNTLSLPNIQWDAIKQLSEYHGITKSKVVETLLNADEDFRTMCELMREAEEQQNEK